MSKKIFISGSIKIRVLPDAIKEKLEVICQKNEQVLVGDADGVDSLIQNFFCKRAYRNLTIYSIYSSPRYNSDNYISKYVFASDEIKSMRERQKVKDNRCQLIVILRWSFGMGEARMLCKHSTGFTVSKVG